MSDPRLDPEAIKAACAPGEQDCGDLDCPDCQGDRYAKCAAVAYDIVKAIAEAPEPQEWHNDYCEAADFPYCCAACALRVWWKAARALVGEEANE